MGVCGDKYLSVYKIIRLVEVCLGVGCGEVCGGVGVGECAR